LILLDAFVEACGDLKQAVEAFFHAFEVLDLREKLLHEFVNTRLQLLCFLINLLLDSVDLLFEQCIKLSNPAFDITGHHTHSCPDLSE